MTVLVGKRRKAESKTYHVLLSRGRRNIPVIRAISPSLKLTARKAQPIITRSSSRARFRYATLHVRRDMPAFWKDQ